MKEKSELPLTEDVEFFQGIKKRMNATKSYEELHAIVLEFKTRAWKSKKFPVGWSTVIEELSFHIASKNGWIQIDDK